MRNNYRLLGAGILIGALAIATLWLLSGEVTYRPDEDYTLRGAPLIITRPAPATTNAAPALSANGVIESSQPEAGAAATFESIAAGVAASDPVTDVQQVLDIAANDAQSRLQLPSFDNAAADPAADEAEAAAPEVPEGNFSLPTSRDAEPGNRVLNWQNAIAQEDQNLDSAIQDIEAAPLNTTTWRIDVASFQQLERAERLVAELKQLLAEELDGAEVYIEGGLRARTNTYFHTIAIGPFASEERALRLSAPIKSNYPSIRNPRIREQQP